MTFNRNPSKFFPVLGAAAVIVVLAGSLGARLISQQTPAPAPVAAKASVPQPAVLDVATLEVPCWTCPMNKGWPLRFRTDLDLLAPLGTGPDNAAEWFVLFTKKIGLRADEAVAARDVRVDGPEWVGKVLPPDHPLLLEAEPWVDQASMRFYPEVLPMEGARTRITNLLVVLIMARSWTARGVDADDPEIGLDDCRRAIRLGRLLRQEDVVIINDLVGLACIHIGTRGVYRIARREGDTDLALLASVVLGEVAPQRMMTAQKISALDLEPYIRREASGELRLDMPDGHFETIATMPETLTERRFFGEIILACHVIVRLGTPEQQNRARGILKDLAADDDVITADFAQWTLDNPVTNEMVAEYYPHPMER